MKAETLIQQHPPTPPMVENELHTECPPVAQFDERQYSFDSANHPSPGTIVHDTIPHHPSQTFQSSPSGSHPGDFGLGIQYVRGPPQHWSQYMLTPPEDGFGQESGYFQGGHFDGLPANNRAIFSGSPPTPRSVDDNDDSGRRMTRSSRTLAPSISPTSENPKPKPAPKPKKSKSGQSDKQKMPKLTAPLSVLTKDMAAIPIRNMEEWVNRSAEMRRTEVEKRNGYVTRPMNSFMLYRSAYAERTKQWCRQNNHQVVSSVSGESWPLEPAEIRDLYNDYAKIERINHQNAHPTYKFSPSKTAAPARKRKSEYSDDDEPSELDDAEWAPGHGRSRLRHSRRSDRSIGYPANAMNTSFFEKPFGLNGNGMTKPTWEMGHDGRPMPIPIQSDMYNQYFPTTGVHPSISMGSVDLEDLRMQRADTPGAAMQFSPDHSILGLPGGNAADLMQQLHSQTDTPLSDAGQVDPMLLVFDGSQPQEMDPAMVSHAEYRNSSMALMDRELDEHSVNNLLGVETVHNEFYPDQWQSDPTMRTMEAGPEFEKWMEDHHASRPDVRTYAGQHKSGPDGMRCVYRVVGFK